MTYNHKDIDIYTLRNKSGMTVQITNFGGRIASILVPDKDGQLQDVVLGFDQLPDYFPENHHSDFGAIIGRYANRLKNGQITVDGQVIQLPRNNGPHCLHGGPTGWQYQVFDVLSANGSQLELALTSPDGDNEFPGTVNAHITYTLSENNELEIHYEATTDKTTVINLTNHSYFNLNGDGCSTILNHLLTINADLYTPIDATYIPSGEILPVAGTPMDFRKSKAVGADISADYEQLRNGNGYDHNWVLNTKGDSTQACARLESPTTGIVLEVFTTEPGIQIYTGNFLDGSVKGKNGVLYPQRSAICLETQKFPDSPNNHWPESNAYLKSGEQYSSHTKFKFEVSTPSSKHPHSL